MGGGELLKGMLNGSKFLGVDSLEKSLFSLDKSGVYVGGLGVLERRGGGGDGEGCTVGHGAQLFGLENSTTFELWNSNHLSILLIGSLNGTVRFFKLLHQF